MTKKIMLSFKKKRIKARLMLNYYVTLNKEQAFGNVIGLATLVALLKLFFNANGVMFMILVPYICKCAGTFIASKIMKYLIKVYDVFEIFTIGNVIHARSYLVRSESDEYIKSFRRIVKDYKGRTLHMKTHTSFISSMLKELGDIQAVSDFMAFHKKNEQKEWKWKGKDFSISLKRKKGERRKGNMLSCYPYRAITENDVKEFDRKFTFYTVKLRLRREM